MTSASDCLQCDQRIQLDELSAPVAVTDTDGKNTLRWIHAGCHLKYHRTDPGAHSDD